MLGIGSLVGIVFHEVRLVERYTLYRSYTFIAWLLGSVVLVYVLAGIGLFSQKNKWCQTILLPFIVYAGSIALFYWWSKCPSLKAAVSPSMYFETLLDLPLYHFSAWGISILVWGGCRFLPVIEKKALVVSIGVMSFISGIFSIIGI